VQQHPVASETEIHLTIGATMAVLDIKAFDGIRPIASPILLGHPEAQTANNANMIAGSLSPILGTTTLKALTKTAPATIWRFGDSQVETEHWLEFAVDTDVIRSPLPTDIWSRTYWADGVQPKYGPAETVISGSSYPGTSYILGIPAPTQTPEITGTAPTVATTSESRTVVFTFVSAYGEEGPPSPVASVVTLDPTAAAVYGNLGGAPSGNYNITTKRIYRSSTVGSAAQFQFVDEIPVGQSSYTDTKSQAALGETLPSDLWTAPPAGLKGLKLMASGAAIGFVGNTAYLSEPNLPHAWPHKYPIDFQIVGIGVFRQTAVLLTKSFPFALNGADPIAMSPERLELPQACVAKGSIVETGDGVIYASPDGLVSIGSGGMDVITRKHFGRKQWQALNPSSIRAFLHDGRYIALYTKVDSSRGILIFDPTGQGPVFTTSTLNASTAITAGYSDNSTDTLYLAQGGNIVRYNTGSALTATWKSKRYRLSAPVSMAAASVDAEAYPVTLKIHADGVLKETKTVSNSSPFRLSSGYRADEWEVEIETSNEVTRIRMASSMDELKRIP